MIFVTGPMFSGKRQYICRALKLSEEELASEAVCGSEMLAAQTEDLEALADELAARRIVIATEMGGGVVPTDAAERRAREAAGQLACLLAERATTVVRVICGLPQILKGDMPC